MDTHDTPNLWDTQQPSRHPQSLQARSELRPSFCRCTDDGTLMAPSEQEICLTHSLRNTKELTERGWAVVPRVAQDPASSLTFLKIMWSAEGCSIPDTVKNPLLTPLCPHNVDTSPASFRTCWVVEATQCIFTLLGNLTDVVPSIRNQPAWNGAP